MRYLMELRTLSPLAIAARPTTPGLPTEGQRHVPGTTFRGALAGKLLRDGVDPDSDRFRSLFLEGRVRYGNLYPVSRGSGLEQEMDHSLPLPATAASCKWQPGFKETDVSMEVGHGVRDTLVAHLAADQEAPSECCRAECEADLVPFVGFYETDGTGIFPMASAGARLISRTAMDSHLGAAKGGALYTVEAVNENQAFSGFLELDSSLAERVKEAVDGVRLRLGSDRTRGLGDVRVASVVPVDEPHLRLQKPVERRLAVFTELLEGAGGLALELRREAGLQGDDWVVFPVTLHSGAVVVDEYLRYQTHLDDGALRMAARCWPDSGPRWPHDLRLVRAFTSTSLRAGWNSAHGLPKPRDPIIHRGSVFAFAAPAHERDGLVSCLRQLEQSGVGRRRDEGFGQVIVCHPFHLQEDPV
jgi:CRISPR-associated protein Csx10